MVVTIIGLGLIGGSLALELKKRLKYTIRGIDKNPAHEEKALKLGIIDEITSFEELGESDVVVLSVPVNFLPSLAIQVLDKVKLDALVFDMGSTKSGICKAIENHEKRTNFVAVHPIAGTEFSGPEAAVYDLFDGKVNIICDQKLSGKDAIEKTLTIFDALHMRTTYMDSAEHDKHIAYVSHLSHISSFMLGKTVLEKEKSEKNIFDMAGSGFRSTVRLAKSSPRMWSPIFTENKENVLAALDGYINNLITFRSLIAQENNEALLKTMEDTNYIKQVLAGINK